ncbi:hypothetical protein ACS0TY_012402 [Phlomoides rotata]
MADFRSKSYNDGKLQIEPYYGPPSATRRNDFRSYSVSHTSSAPPLPQAPPPQKLKRGRSTSSSSKSWSLNDPEFQRKRRVASYKVYSVEGKVKGSFSKSFRWLKHRYIQVVYGWW